jgi:hypothetical protein
VALATALAAAMGAAAMAVALAVTMGAAAMAAALAVTMGAAAMAAASGGGAAQLTRCEVQNPPAAARTTAAQSNSKT